MTRARARHRKETRMGKLTPNLRHYRKAIQGAVGAGTVALIVAYFFPPSQWTVTQAEWQAVLGAVLGGAGLPVVGKANDPKRVGKRRAQ